MRRRRFLTIAGVGALLGRDILSAQGPAQPLNSGARTLLGGWRLGQDYARGTIAIDFSRMKAWMAGHAQRDDILEFDLPAMGTGADVTAWPRLMPVRTIPGWWPTSLPGAQDVYANGLLWWRDKLWAAPRVFYAVGEAVTAPLTIFAQDGEQMRFRTLPRQIFSGFVKRGPGLDPFLGCGGYESGQGNSSGPTLATLSGKVLINHGPFDGGWDQRAPREPNYFNLEETIRPWIGLNPRMIRGVRQGRWTTDFVFGGGLVLPSGVSYWPYMGTGDMFYGQQRLPEPRTYAYRYDLVTYKLLDFTAAPEFGDGPVLGQELGPDGKVYLAHGGRGLSSNFSPQDIALKVFG